MRADQLNDASVGGGDRSGAEFADQNAASDSFDQTDDAMAIGRTDDGVHFPVSDLLTERDSEGALGDVTFSGEAAALLGAGMTFSPFRRLTQEAEQLAAPLFVTTDEPIDRFMADVEPSFQTKPATHLIRAQPFTEEANDEFPVGDGEPDVPWRLGTAPVGLLLRSHRAIDAVAVGLVACDLPSDGASMAAH